MALTLQQFLTAMGDAVIICDVAGTITAWNPAAERLFGFTESEALGASLDIIIPERQRQRHWSGYQQTMHSGPTRYGTSLLHVPALTRDGSTISIAFTVTLLPGENGKPASIVAIIRDETTRFNEDRALRKRLAEAEARVQSTPPS
ncbi:PAS domain S-box protein [Dickeya dianthicola]|uniref:PAS domain-containing protein n=1 Tax=Dickeya dianthicola TaxID=204039 RepID=UPI0013702156|nr:PAS domain-containing protein [Dickeya dianthicola]MBT1426152.1 PAS domain-containing protein [Dickeya dianthicola]MBT1457672.1 PAS domain-containing protein [Dickeya dianthicola]MBT1486814.1 PAS domain-containing protein [Dickeya dianthicola]MCI4237273.1 PAS domain-containing protein [Dickeya dianthicola]MCI4255147.1 PAS domain-containing protein [Dickeya dianthicola]